METTRFTEADRDSDGFIRLSPPTPDAAPAMAAPTVALPTMRRGAQSPQRVPRIPRSMIVLYAGGMIGLVLIALTVWFGAAPARITPAPTAIASNVTSPTFAPRATPAPAMIAAYGAPNEAPRWQIEATREMTPVAHLGDDWIQADVQGSGVIWLKASDWPSLAVIGPDLAVQPTAIPVARRAVQPAAEPPIVVSLPSPGDVQQALTIPAQTIGERPADDRAAHHAAAVARDHDQRSHASSAAP